MVGMGAEAEGSDVGTKILIFFSNPYIFESALLDAVQVLSARFRVTVLMVEVDRKSSVFRTLYRMKSNGTLDDVQVLVPARGSGGPSSRSPWKPAGALFAMRREAIFWSRNLSALRAEKFSLTIIHSESLVSDFVAPDLARTWDDVLVVHPVLRDDDKDRSTGELWNKRIRRLRVLVRTVGPFHGLEQLALALQASIYRALAPQVYFWLTGRRIARNRFARRFFCGGNFGGYIVAPGAAFDEVSSYQTSRDVSSYQFDSELDSHYSGELGRAVLLIGAYNGRPRQVLLDQVCDGLVELCESFNLTTVIVRPHPRCQHQAVDFVRSLVERGINASVSAKSSSLKDDVLSASIIFGLATSSLFDSLTWADGRPVIGFASAFEYEGLDCPTREGVSWYTGSVSSLQPPEILHSNATTIGSASNEKKTLSSFIENFIWSSPSIRA